MLAKPLFMPRSTPFKTPLVAPQDKTARLEAPSRAARRRDVFIWAAVILFLNQFFVMLKGMPTVSLETLMSGIGNVTHIWTINLRGNVPF